MKNKSQISVPQNGDGDSKTVWQWKGDQDQWEPYPEAACRDLDSAVAAGNASFTLSLESGHEYHIDLKKMFQINPVTKYKRKIRSQAMKTETTNAEPENRVAATNDQNTEVKQEEEEETEKPPAPKKRRGQSKSQTKTKAAPKEEVKAEVTEVETVKTVVMKGKAPVDPECKAKLGKAHVYSEGEDVYDVMLNQTNLQFNNNKYYLIQLLEDDNSKSYSVWMRWGRVGKVGQNSLVACGGDLPKAKKIFMKKFEDKTDNDWENREYFEKEPGKYDLLFVDYSANYKEEPKPEPAAAAVVKKPSTLDPKVQSLLELICDLKAMEECVLEMKFDTRKAPLGKLTTEQIRAGYAALKKIEDCLKRKGGSRDLLEACNQFYTRIPHDFGLKTPPIIRTEEELKEKIKLLEALSDIQIAVKMVQSSSGGDEHILDQQYKSLDCGLQPLEASAHEYQVIERYLQTTHASTHGDYTMTVLDIFAVDRAAESQHFLKDLHNRTLLWHGSRLTNWVGILSKGLRIAPPEAPVTGYMFGKGIYFADMSSKSANYCFATRQNNVGLLLLCEVALGDANDLLDANYEADKLPPGKHSTKGLGQTGPDPRNAVTLDGMTVPMGPGVSTGAANKRGYSLLYNEFIVYNPSQARMRYLLRVRFNYSSLW
uniref:Poly [ADP-ribose] polymerase n=1 Tax=Knipowitschia caucasica TaxID=637954 RepID=A0AAV2JNQ0_KNICA